MNLGLNFQRNKVNRLIQVNGQIFTFKRQNKNEFGEPIKDDFDEITVKAFFHESSGYVSRVGAESSTTRSKPMPSLLCTIDEGKKLNRNDILSFSGKEYIVSEIKDVNELGIFYDVSLEEVQNG